MVSKVGESLDPAVIAGLTSTRSITLQIWLRGHQEDQPILQIREKVPAPL
jgi:hypothetical protein